MTDKERFEKWYREHIAEPYLSGFDFYRPDADFAFTIWQAARRWIPVEEKKIPLNEFVLCGLWVDDVENDYSYFDTYFIYFDDEFEPRDKWENYLSEWEYDEFTHWQPITQPPEEE